MTCGHWQAGRYCGANLTRVYMTGDRCAEHTPARLAGRLEVVIDTDRTLESLRTLAGRRWGFNRNDTALADTRAVARGQRVSGARRRAQHEADADARR